MTEKQIIEIQKKIDCWEHYKTLLHPEETAVIATNSRIWGLKEAIEIIRSHPPNAKPHTIVPGTTIFVSTDGWKVCRVGQGTECDLFKDDVYVCTTPDESVAFRIKTAMRE